MAVSKTSKVVLHMIPVHVGMGGHFITGKNRKKIYIVQRIRNEKVFKPIVSSFFFVIYRDYLMLRSAKLGAVPVPKDPFNRMTKQICLFWSIQ